MGSNDLLIIALGGVIFGAIIATGQMLRRERSFAAGRFWAYVGTVLGIAVSAAANYAESSRYAPVWLAIGMGTVPVFLLISLEILVRNRIKEHLAWWRGGLLTVAIASGLTSYAHMAMLIWHNTGERIEGAGTFVLGVLFALSLIVPVVPDGTMVLATVALLYDPSREIETPAILNPQPEPETSMGTPKVRRERPSKPQREPGQRLSRPQDHPLYEDWLSRRGTGEAYTTASFAASEGSTEAAARSRMQRWERSLRNTNPQVETEGSPREEVSA